jgi:hypothetical protein
MLIFVVARRRLDRYEELHRQFRDRRDVRIVLDRREGERRTPQRQAVARADRRQLERRQWLPDLRKLGWFVVDTDDLVS